MGERYKLCRECGSEFVAAVETCIDCGGPLEEAVLGAEEAMTAPPVGSPAAEEPMAPLREGEPGFLRDLAERLAIAGVPHRLAVHGDCTTGCRTRYAVYVRPADWAAAVAVDRAFYAAAVPGGEGAVELDGDGCPACGTSLAPGAVECPECGLMVGGPGEADEVAG